MTQNKQAWGSRLGLILAMAGNAVGLGNFLRFPIQAVQNGGGAFIIPYIVSFILLGIPLVLMEWAIGKHGGIAGYHATPLAMQHLHKNPFWKYTGALAVFSSMVIASYYSYIESWTLSYALHSIFGTFNGMTETEISSFFNNYLDINHSTLGIPYEPIVLFVFCLCLNTFFLTLGIKNGIERVAKICMPLLLIFGLFLAIRAITIKEGVDGAIYDGLVGFNFMWEPHYDSLKDPKVWLAAAGQMFFTLSLGMGCVQCYASYLKPKDDIALNSMTAGFTNEFIEIVIGSAIIIPISIGYFGIDKVIELTHSGGFGLGFRTMPYLFEQWGGLLSAVAGLAFFGLLFFAGITSCLALSIPSTEFFKKYFGWTHRKSAVFFSFLILILGLPSILFFNNGVFDQFDYWGGTVSLFVFAMLESIAFAWFLGANKGWDIITQHADIKLPIIIKYIIKFVTPTILIIIFIGSLIKPKDDNWSLLSLNGWELDNSSIISELTNKNLGPNRTWFSSEFYAENEGHVLSIENKEEFTVVTIGDDINSVSYDFDKNSNPLVKVNDYVKVGDAINSGSFINNTFYIDISRILLAIIFLIICIIIRRGAKKMKQ